MRNYIKNFLIFVMSFVILGGSTVFAIEDIKIKKGTKLTLNDCIKIAFNNSPTLKEKKYNYGISKTNIGVAKSAYFPVLGVGTGYNLGNITSTQNNNNNNVFNAEASLKMLIFNFGKANANIKMQKLKTIATLLNFNNEVLNTDYTVKKNYYTVLAGQAQVDVSKLNVQINERNYQRTKAYFEEGIKSKIDLVNAEVNLSEAKITLVEAEKAYKTALIQLCNSMYIANAPEFELEPTENFKLQKRLFSLNVKDLDKNADISILPKNVTNATLTASAEKTEILEKYVIKPFPYTFEQAVEFAYKTRYDIQAYEATIDAMKENVKYIRRAYYPEINASTGYAFKDKNSVNSFTVGVNLTSSLNIMSQKNQLDAAKLQLQLAENDLYKIKQNTYFNVETAYMKMLELEKQIPLAAIKVKQAKENFELADGRYAVGLGDYIELEDARVKYNNAQHSYVEKVYNYNLERANLEYQIAYPRDVNITIEEIK